MPVRIALTTLHRAGYADEAAFEEAILYARAELECHAYTEGEARPRYNMLVEAIVHGDGTYELWDDRPPEPPQPSPEELAAAAELEANALRKGRQILNLGELLVAKGLLSREELDALGDPPAKETLPTLPPPAP